LNIRNITKIKFNTFRYLWLILKLEYFLVASFLHMRKALIGKWWVQAVVAGVFGCCR